MSGCSSLMEHRLLPVKPVTGKIEGVPDHSIVIGYVRNVIAGDGLVIVEKIDGIEPIKGAKTMSRGIDMKLDAPGTIEDVSSLHYFVIRCSAFPPVIEGDEVFLHLIL